MLNPRKLGAEHLPSRLQIASALIACALLRRALSHVHFLDGIATLRVAIWEPGIRMKQGEERCAVGTKGTKLTWEQVRLARMYYLSLIGLSPKKIAWRLGVSTSYVTQLMLMRIWIEDTQRYFVPDFGDRMRLCALWMSQDVTNDTLQEAFLAVAEPDGVFTAVQARKNRKKRHREYVTGIAHVSIDSDGYVTRVEGVPEKCSWKNYVELHDAINGLIDRVIAEIERIWSVEDFGGSRKEYAWLQLHYGISEEEDVRWQFILEDSLDEEADDLDADDGEMRVT